MKVLAAMSGGVDSAVAAARAVDAGHDVTGVHLALSPAPATLREGARGCCTLEDANDARRAADVLGIPFYVWDLAERFRADVIDDFVAEYAAGRTPNPCLRCNEKIKFAAVLDRALALGFDAVVTGHHARLERRPADALRRRGEGPVLRARRPHPRSSWPARCSRWAIRPRHRSAPRPRRVGSRSPRSLIRTTSASSPTATPAASCPAVSASRPGRSSTPRAVTWSASMRGSFAFTVGQRRGLHLQRPAPGGEPRYVLTIQPKSNTVVVGPGEMLDAG